MFYQVILNTIYSRKVGFGCFCPTVKCCNEISYVVLQSNFYQSAFNRLYCHFQFMVDVNCATIDPLTRYEDDSIICWKYNKITLCKDNIKNRLSFIALLLRYANLKLNNKERKT